MLDASVEEVTDYTKMAAYGYGGIPLPAIIVNKKIVSTGEIPQKFRIADFLINASIK